MAVAAQHSRERRQAEPGRGVRGLERGLEGAEMPGGTYESRGCRASPRAGGEGRASPDLGQLENEEDEAY